MRSLFHSPFPCTQPPSQQPSPTATVSLQSEMCHRPHPAPMRRQRRSPVLLSAARPLPGPALTGPWPTVTRSQGARHTAPPSLPHAAARAHRAPSPEYRPAAARSHWARLVRIAPTACRHPHPPMSPPSRSRAHRPPSRPSCAAVLHVLRFAVRIAPTVRRRPRHPHLPPRVAAAPGPWLARTAPYASLFRRMREKGPLPGNIRPKCMLFEIKMATSSPHASHFRAQSGDSGYMARESCRQGPFFASRSPKSRMARRCCQRRPAFPRQRHAAWPNGLCAMRQRPAVRRNWLCAMRRGPGLLAACAPLPSCLCPPRPAPPAISPAFIAAVLHAPRFAVRDPPRGPRTDASRHLRAAPIPPAALTHRVQETSGTTQTTQCGHKNRIPKWGPY